MNTTLRIIESKSENYALSFVNHIFYGNTQFTFFVENAEIYAYQYRFAQLVARLKWNEIAEYEPTFEERVMIESEVQEQEQYKARQDVECYNYFAESHSREIYIALLD